MIEFFIIKCFIDLVVSGHVINCIRGTELYGRKGMVNAIIVMICFKNMIELMVYISENLNSMNYIILRLNFAGAGSPEITPKSDIVSSPELREPSRMRYDVRLWDAALQTRRAIFALIYFNIPPFDVSKYIFTCST